jgi:hypothetical protein
MRLIYFLFFLVPASLLAQTATLRGVVTDETGAVIPSARVTVNGPNGARAATSGNDGSYVVTGLATGDYTVQASAPDLALPQPIKVTLNTGIRALNLQLKVAATVQQITVEDRGAPTVSTEASSNASAVTLKGSDLDALSDDLEDLQSDLQALAGPSAGPSGGSIFIDGFSGGQLPSKDSIREIRINQNPFSPEYDKLGLGRIEIFTKPGADKFRGTVAYNFGDDFWNTRNPYAAQKAPFSLNELGGNLSGPISKRASFSLDLRRELVDNGSVINGATLEPLTLAVIDPYTSTFLTPQRRTTVTPRGDYQLNSNNTLTVLYKFNRDDIRDAGIGSLNLVSRGYHSDYTNQTVQITETAVLTTAVINETRFQYFRPALERVPNDVTPSLQVLGAFNGGGAQTGHSLEAQNTYELQNNTSITHGVHFWRFGVRLRAQTDDSVSPQNFGGTFTFGGGLAPKLDANNQPVLDSSGNPLMVVIKSIERYRRTLLLQQLGYPAEEIRALGGGATQFSINAGNPALSAHQADVGAFVGDDWRVRPNLTLNLGLRYETQTNIHDWRDFAPRIGLAWAPAAKSLRPKTVLRAGFGMFYDRFALSNTVAALRYNGIIQQQYVVTDPSILNYFPNIPPVSALEPFQSAQTIQQVDSKLRAPYIMQSAFSLERQVPGNTTIALTYANSHGLHVFRSRDINAPLPGTYDPNVAGSGVFPYGAPGPILQMESSGVYNQNQFIVNVNTRVRQNVSLFGSYLINRARSNSDGLNTFPANPYNFAGEYGPALTDVHNSMTFGGSIDTKWNVRLSPLVAVDSGPPFDVTAGSDLYGTTLFNGRPGIAIDPNKPGVIPTQYGWLDPNPSSDEKILPRNYGRGPGQIRVNFRISKTFGFGSTREGRGGGPGGGGGGGGARSANPFGTGGGPQGANAGPSNRRFNLTVSMSALNLINHNNPGPIIGNITSPLFGRANQPAGGGFGLGGGGQVNNLGGGFSENANNRRLELQTRLTF